MKETISKVKTQPSEWEKLIASETTDKEIIPNIYKQLIQFNTRKVKNKNKNWAKDLNRHFSKEDIQIDNKYMKMLNITYYQRKSNQNHSEVPSYITQNGCHQKAYK